MGMGLQDGIRWDSEEVAESAEITSVGWIIRWLSSSFHWDLARDGMGMGMGMDR